jgi:hypothetical protein
MGTAGQAFTGGDPNEKKLVDQLNALLEDKPVPNVRTLNDDEKKGLEQAFRQAVENAIFKPGADAITRTNVSQAVQGTVMNDMLRKYKDWLATAGRDPWPFPKKHKP